MSRPEFAHLHVHSEYSLLDGANRIGDLVQACVDDGQTALALTDHGNMYGAIELYQKCRAGSITPIVGCEVYVARDSRLKKHSKKHNPYSHLTLLARNREGYQNLIKLASMAFVEGYHYKPRIDRALLQDHAAGITCLSGCLSSEMSQLARAGKESEAERVAGELRDLFGPDHFWLELQRNGIQIQEDYNEALVRIHQRTGIPLIGTNDIHYLRHEDCMAQDVLLCINTGAKRTDENRFKMDTDTLFFRTREEMAHVFRDLPQCLPATLDVVEQVDLEIEFGKYHVPVFRSDTGEDPLVLFDRLTRAGLEKRYGPGHTQALERLAYERGVIQEMGFISYFLIVWDLIDWARRNDIPVGPGRGSAAGSIVAYALDITRVDPLEYDLLFERFLNSARVSMPDIDIDFCKEGRERVLQYTRDRYGVEHVAQIATFGTMASRTVVRDVGRVLDVPLRDVNRIAKKIPAGPNAPSLAEALKTDSDLIEIRKELPELDELFELSVSLEGMARHISTHAAGVVIADRPITEYVPLCTQGDDVATQWTAPQLEELGLLKMDYLGLRTLTILERTLRNIEKLGGVRPDLENLPAGDPATYAMLTSGDTLGVFQLESEGMRKLLARMKPDCFEDLIAALALYRPGPLESGMVEMYVDRKHGNEPVVYEHPVLEELLADTYGCIVYQEQVMLLSSQLAGFSLNEADNLRKAMGKKKPEVMKKYSAQFQDGAERSGCARDVAGQIWDNIVKFGGYGFNKSHSTAYAKITYQTAYLKAHYRTAFTAGNMSCEMQSSDKIKDFVDDSRKHGIEVVPPSIAYSAWEFEPRADAIAFGLGAVKGTGQRAIEALVAARAGLQDSNGAGGATSLHDLCGAVDPSEVGKVCWEALIKAGCFDCTGHNRGAVMAALEAAMADGSRAAADRRAGQGDLFGDAAASDQPRAGQAGHPDDGISDAHAWNQADTLRAEYEVLGFYLSGHPLEERAGLFRILSNTTTRELAKKPGGSEVMLAGLIVNLTENPVRSGRMAGQKMARFRLEDLEGNVAVTCFPRTYAESREKVQEDAIVVCRAKLEERDDEPALLLEEILTPEEALGRFQGGILIHLAAADQEHLGSLRELLDRHRGKLPLYFQVDGSDGHLRQVRAGSRHGVTLSAELADAVDSLLGRGRMRLARM